MGNIKSKRDPSTLSDAEIQLLLHKTDLSRDDILEWHKEFIEEHPDGQVNYDEFLRLYKGIINPNVEGEKFAKALFTFFDNEKNEKLAFSDFLVLTPFEVRPKQVVAEEPVKKESEEVEKAVEEAKEEENKENKEGENKEGEAEEKKESEPQENKEEDKKEEAKEGENKEGEAQETKEGENKEGEAQETKEDEKKVEAQENKEGETKDGEAQESKDSDNKEVKEEEAKQNGDEEAAKTTTSKPLEIDDVDEKTLELALAILNERDEKIDKEELFKIPYILCETAGENAASIFETDEQFAKKKFFLFENDKLDRDEFLRLIRAAKRFAAQ